MSELASAATWQPPALRVITAADAQAQQAQQLEEARERGYQEGLQRGQEAGRVQAEALLGQMTALWDAMQQPFADMEENIHSHLMGLSLAMSEAVIRRELSTDRDAIARVLTEALSALGFVQTPIEVSVNPADHDVVAGLLSGENIDSRITADPNIQRGGCMLRADRALVDMRVETMIRETLTTIAGATRRVDDSGRETAPALSVSDIESIADRFSESPSAGVSSTATGEEDV
ncbi:MAG: FliH/SctL family protein [Luminiphilus sp.]|jgi:flagellar biosynthesis/type III secretory pathway protein FliH|nr:FliH/SctL family protein [Luminiphilus sp.]MDG1461488.1 FliH/SctL family protein [Luminiphilus sp.]